MPEPQEKKRKAPPSAEDDAILGYKKAKQRQRWNQWTHRSRGNAKETTIQPGDSGIFATCIKNKESKCIGELRDLFDDFAERLYGNSASESNHKETTEVDVEAELRNELEDMQNPSKEPLFSNVHIDVQCVLFFKTREPVEPVSFVRTVCEDAAHNKTQRTRFVQRLTPMSVMGKATEAGLEDAAMKAVAPHFHDESKEPKKFAIRCNSRNHSTLLKRENVIKKVADIVGPRHQVDLTNFDALILVEVYKNICGISVVDKRYEELKRFNLSEIHAPSADVMAKAKNMEQAG